MLQLDTMPQAPRKYVPEDRPRLSATSLQVRANVTATAVVDGTPPVTTSTVLGTAGAGAWYRSPVEVSLRASDALSGVAGTWYRLDGGNLQNYSGTVSLAAEGAHTLEYYSRDEAGNVEAAHTLSFGVDGTPPSIQATSPSDAATATSSRVTVSWTGHDATSGIAGYEVGVDGGLRPAGSDSPSRCVPTAWPAVIRLSATLRSATSRCLRASRKVTASITRPPAAGHPAAAAPRSRAGAPALAHSCTGRR